MSRRPKSKTSTKSPPNRTYAGTSQELVAALHSHAEWPERERGTLAQRTRKQKNASGERAAAAHDLISELGPYLRPEADLQLFLDESRPAPRPPDRVGASAALVRRSSRTRIRLAGRFLEGQAFKVEVAHDRKSHRACGHYESDEDGERTGRWIAGRVSEAYKTRVELSVRLQPAAAEALNLDELAWLMNLPTWTKDTQLQFKEDALRFASKCNGIAMPGDLAEWIMSAVAAITTQRRAPTPDSGELDPDVSGLFRNLVLAVLVDGRLDPSEVSFLSTRARWLGLSTEQAQRLAAEVTSGTVKEFYRPEDPVACRVTFRQAVQALYADGELEERERKLIRFLGGGLRVNQGDLAQALGEVPPGPAWEFVPRPQEP
jgi:hypothetical protein